MSGYVPNALRRAVAARAHGLCEYCLIHEDDTFFGCEIEHVITAKHGGGTTENNLAQACAFCNRFKGSDIGTLSTTRASIVPLFNPRVDRWHEHFQLAADGVTIVGLTEVGEATARLLQLNHPDRILERQTLREVNRYPSAPARSVMEP